MARLAKLSSKNQVTLPKAVLKGYPEVEYFDVSVSEAGILLKPLKAESGTNTLEAMQQHFKRLGLTPDDVKQAVRWARGKKPVK